MYAGRIIETGTKNEVLYNPQHPYTWGLLSSLPSSAINGKMTGIPGTLDLSLLKDNQDGFVFRNNIWLLLPNQKSSMNENDKKEFDKVKISKNC